MFRCLLFIALTWVLFPSPFLLAEEDGPLISITSPDTASTFVYGSIKSHSLLWNKRTGVLIARVTFTDSQFNNGQANEDAHEFRLPGIRFDEAKGIFLAISPKGDLVPVAHVKKALFFKTVETLPNANVRIQRRDGNVTVILEAISPNDPAMHASPPDANPDDAHKVDVNKILH